uniref:DUF2442 domain-containing protein n=1 Tax=Gemmatimonas sp. TaxID=1962908 RepID=UPI0027B8801D
MSISAAGIGARAIGVSVEHAMLRVTLADGREIAAPLRWFPLLEAATTSQRDNWRLIGGGGGIHFPDVDEDISVAGLLVG